MEKNQNRNNSLNVENIDIIANQLDLLGFGIINIVNFDSNDQIHILFQKGIGRPLIQNVIELCKKEISDQRQGNSIIPLDESTIFIHYFQNKQQTIVMLYMAEKDQMISFPKLYMLTKKISNRFRLNSPLPEIIEICNKAINIPQMRGIIGIFIMGASGCPYFSKINSNRKIMSNKQVHIGGFISALFSFSQEIIGKDSGAELKEINFGNQRFYMITQNNVIYAFLVEKLNKKIENYMYLIADEFFEQFKDHLCDFNGDVTPFNEFESKIDQYFDI